MLRLAGHLKGSRTLMSTHKSRQIVSDSQTEQEKVAYNLLHRHGMFYDCSVSEGEKPTMSK